MLYANIGTISHGTMRSEDLIPAFCDEIEYQLNRNAAEFCSDAGRATRDRILSVVGDAREMLDDDGSIRPEFENDDFDMVHQLADILNEFAAPFCYFGAHAGDGSDYGFWPDFDAIESDDDMLRVSDLADIPPEYSGAAIVVNDHGNGAVYNVESGAARMLFDYV